MSCGKADGKHILESPEQAQLCQAPGEEPELAGGQGVFRSQEAPHQPRGEAPPATAQGAGANQIAPVVALRYHCPVEVVMLPASPHNPASPVSIIRTLESS